MRKVKTQLASLWILIWEFGWADKSVGPFLLVTAQGQLALDLSPHRI